MGGMKKLYGAEGRTDLRNFDANILILIEDPEHALFDKRALDPPDENMIKSVAKYGVIQPVVIAIEDEKAIVVAGRRRVLAAREASARLVKEGGKPIMVPCILRRGSDDSLLGACIAENAHRKEVGFVERGRMASRLLNMGHSKADVAADFNVGIQTLMQWVALDECSQAIKKAVEGGKVGLVVALEVAKLPKADQGAAMAKLTENGPVKGAAGMIAAKRVREGKDTGDEQVANRLSKKFLKKLVGTLVAEGHEDEAELVSWLVGNEEYAPEHYEDAVKGALKGF